MCALSASAEQEITLQRSVQNDASLFYIFQGREKYVPHSRLARDARLTRAAPPSSLAATKASGDSIHPKSKAFWRAQALGLCGAGAGMGRRSGARASRPTRSARESKSKAQGHPGWRQCTRLPMRRRSSASRRTSRRCWRRHPSAAHTKCPCAHVAPPAPGRSRRHMRHGAADEPAAAAPAVERRAVGGVMAPAPD